MNCDINRVPQGMNRTCNGVKEKIINFIVVDPTFAGFSPFSGETLPDINDIASWTDLANAGLAYRFKAFAQDATKEGGDAVTLENTSSGKNYHIRYNLVSFMAGLETNECDFNEMKRVFKPGSEFQVFEETKSNLYGWKDATDGVPELKGFTAEIVANPNSQAAESSTASFEVKITYQEAEELDYPFVNEKPSRFGVQFESAIPFGLNLEIKDLSTLATATVYVSDRCGAGKAGIAPGDFYADGVALGAATDDGDGFYTMDLTGVSELQVKEGTPTLTHVSNVLDL